MIMKVLLFPFQSIYVLSFPSALLYCLECPVQWWIEVRKADILPYSWFKRESLQSLTITYSTSVQFSCSVVSNSETPRTAACQASLSITNSQTLPKLMSIESVMPSNHLILCHPLLLLPSIFPNIRVFFKWVSSWNQVAKILEFQLQHQSFQWTPRTDLF